MVPAPMSSQISDGETGKGWSVLWQTSGDEKDHWGMDGPKMPVVSDDPGKGCEGLRNWREALEIMEIYKGWAH